MPIRCLTAQSAWAHGPRVAAVLARCALEDWLDEQCAEWCSAAAGYGPTTISKLVVLGTRHGAQVGERAKRTWQGLSRAVHHHSYELAPSETEVRHLAKQVRTLDTATQATVSS